MERGLDAFEVVFGNGLQAVDDGVQIDRHLLHFVVIEMDARVFRYVAHIPLGHMLCHAHLLSASFANS